MKTHWRHQANTIKLVLPSGHWSPQPKRQLNPFGLFGTAHGRVSSGKLVPPGKCDWTCAYFDSPKSTTQMATRSVQTFLHSSRQILYNGRPFPLKLLLPMGISGLPCNTIPWAHLSPKPKRHLHWFSRFCTDDRRVSLHFTTGCPFTPSKLPLPRGIWTLI